SAEPGEPTLRAQNEARQAELRTGVRADPLVAAVLARFPGAEIVGVRTPALEPPVALVSGEPDDAFPFGEPEDTSEPPPADDGSVYGAEWREENSNDDAQPD